MTYQRFEDLPVWQKAMELAEKVYDLTEAEGFKASFSLRDQIERAAISVSNNIAEGFERGTTNELLAFIYVARGSSGEVRSMLCFMERRKAFQVFQISNIKFEIHRRGLFAPIARVGGIVAKFRHQRRAPFEPRRS